MSDLLVKHNLRDDNHRAFSELYVAQHLSQQVYQVTLHSLRLPDETLTTAAYVDDLHQLGADLERLCHVARAIGVAWMDESGTTLEQKSTKVRAVLLELWNSAYTEFELRRSKESGHKVKRRELRVQMPCSEATRNEYRYLRQSAELIQSSLLSMMKDATHFVQSKPHSRIALLSDPLFLSYCRVQDVITQCPDLQSSAMQVTSSLDFPTDLLSSFRGHLMVTATSRIRQKRPSAAGTCLRMHVE